MFQEREPFITLVAVGDVAPNRNDPPSIFRFSRDALRSGDILFGQAEYPMTDKGSPVVKGAHVLPPHNVKALTDEGAGFDVMSVACNHCMDYGWGGFLDWLDNLKKNNIAIVGGGNNIGEARRPVIVERQGTRVGFLANLSCTEQTTLNVADEQNPGIAPLRATTFYQQVDPQPGSHPWIITKLFPEDKAAMVEDIRKLRPQVDVLVVSMHCGLHNVPALIAAYQKEAAYAAIDAGADLVLQHHAHILKGVEVYKGRVIFYGMNTFGCEQWLDPVTGKMPPRRLGGTRHPLMHGGEPLVKYVKQDFYGTRATPGYEKLAHLYDGLKTMMVKIYIQNNQIQKVTYVPAYINPHLEPEVLARKDPRAQEVFDYVAKISDHEDLKVNFAWEGDEVLIGEG